MVTAIAEVEADSLQSPSHSKFKNPCLNHIYFYFIFFFKFGIVESPKSKIQPCHEMF